jgi:hypothetical protein
MLRLLAQREQGYEDMAALMGVSVEELRARVKEALGELEREGKEAPPLPAPPAAAEPPKAEAEGPRAEVPAPKEPAAAPKPPVAAEPPERRATPPAGAAPPSKPERGFSLPSSSGARIGIAAVAAAIVVVVVLLIVLGGGSGSSTTTVTTSAEAPSGGAVQEAVEAAESSGSGKEVTKAVLESVDGGAHPSGIAIFGRVKDKLALQIVAEGLEPLGAGESYAIWIAQSPRRMLPLAASPVKGGRIASQFEVPTEVLAYLANETFGEIAVTKASIPKLNAALRAATKAKEAPSYTGAPVMRGPITGPIIGAAKHLEEENGSGG